MKLVLFILVTVFILIAVYVILQGYIMDPKLLGRIVFLKDHEISIADIKKKLDYSTISPINWKIIMPNITFSIIMNGGIGNTILAYCIGVNACMNLGIRSPILLTDSTSDFDYHRINKKDSKILFTSISEIFPHAHIISLNSSYSPFFFISNKSVWDGSDINNIKLKRNIIQYTNYDKIKNISNRATEYVRKSISKDILMYIRKKYGKLKNCMAVHLRLGQTTDFFIPASPDEKDITKYYEQFKPERVLVFTDNKLKAIKVLEKINMNYTIIDESAPIELIMLGMCGSAIISQSTFSAIACRLFNRKKVVITVSRKYFVSFLDKKWIQIKK